MDLSATDVDHTDPNQQILSCSHGSVKIQTQLGRGGVAIFAKHGIGNAAHSLVRHQGCAATMEGMDHISHCLRGVAEEQILSPVLVTLQKLHPQITADRTICGFINPGNSPAQMLQIGIMIIHIHTPFLFHRHIMPQGAKNVNDADSQNEIH